MESLIRSALTIPAVLESEEQGVEVLHRLDEQISEWLADPPRIDDPLEAFGGATFFPGYYGADVRPLNEKIAAFYLRACPSLRFTAPHAVQGAPRRSAQRLRVGFISRYLIDHVVSRLTAGMISEMPSDEFETILLRFPTRLTRLFDAVRLVKYAPHLSQIESMAYPSAGRTVDLSKDVFKAREEIAALELDVLVYLDIGMEPHTYFLALSRLAPVQCAMWGHPVTTGMPTIDYFVSADGLERPGAEADYTERLVRLERIPCFYRRIKLPDEWTPREQFGGAPGTRIYACPQSPFKFLPVFDDALARLLDADPTGVLVMIGDESIERVATLAGRLSRRMGKAFQRVRFAGHLERGAFLSLLRAADVALDPFHFGGGNTTYESMAVGTPIVTMPGRYMRGRITAACYRQMGVKEDLIVEDPDAYVRTALSIAADPALREQHRAQLIERGEQLFEDRAAVDSFAAFLRRAAPVT